MPKKCPSCSSTSVTQNQNGFKCKKCNYCNIPDFVTDILDKKHEKRYKVGGSKRIQK